MPSVKKTEVGKRRYNKRPNAPKITDTRCQIASAVQGLQGLLPTYHYSEKELRRGKFLDLIPAVSESDHELLNVDPPYPLGARIVLERDASLLPALVKGSQFFPKGHTLKPECCIPDSREEIRIWVAWRFHYLLDYGARPNWKGKIDQGVELAEAWRAIAGFNFETVVAAFEWLWDFQVPGGRSGVSSFETAWRRDLLKFAQRRHRSAPLTDPLEEYASEQVPGETSYFVVEHLLRRIFELEHAWEYVRGYLDRLVRSKEETWSEAAYRLAEVSPLALVWALHRGKIVREGDPSAHAITNVAILETLRLSHQTAEGGNKATYERALGYDDLGYLIHILFWMWRENPKSTGALHEHDASLLFRVALNFLAWIDDSRAKLHLLKLFRTRRKKSLHDELAAAQMPSMFAPPPRATADLPLWRGQFPDDIAKLGSNLVRRRSEEERDRETRGLRDPAQNPSVRASYCPDAWSKDLVSEALLESWTCMHPALQRLDRHYASPHLQTKQLTSALRFAINLSEMPTGPAVDYILGCSIAPLNYTPEFALTLGAAKKLHSGQESRISGLPTSKKRLGSDVLASGSALMGDG